MVVYLNINFGTSLNENTVRKYTNKINIYCRIMFDCNDIIQLTVKCGDEIRLNRVM